MPLRDVIQLPRFTQDFEMYRRNYPDMDEVYRETISILLDKPSVGEPIGVAPDLRYYLTYPTDDTPGFWITYEYDTENIYLHSIKKVEF